MIRIYNFLVFLTTILMAILL